MQRRRLAWMISAAIVLPGTAWAQAADPALPADEVDSGSAAEIVVTAQKRAQKLSDVGLSVAALGGEELGKLGVSRPEDLTKAVSGLTVADNNGNPTYTLRGVGYNDRYTFTTNSNVSTYVDEIPLIFPAMTRGAIFDLDRVEVLKGPQGTLFGQNATGGAVNYIAAKPTDATKGGVEVGYGSFGAFEANGFLSGSLSDTVTARIAASTEQGGDWQYDPMTGKKFGARKIVMGRGQVRWEPSSDLTFLLNVNGWIDKSDTQSPQFVQANPQFPAFTPPGLGNYEPLGGNNRKAYQDPAFKFARDDNFVQASLRADWTIAPLLTLTSLTSFSRLRINSLDDADGVGITINHLRSIVHTKAFNQELRLSGRTEDSRLNYIVGFNYGDDDSSSYSIQLLRQSPVRAFTPPFDTNGNQAFTKNKTYAFFANADLELAPGLTATGGVRYTHFSHNYSGCSFDIGTRDGPGGEPSAYPVGAEAAAFQTISNSVRTANGLAPVQAFSAGNCITFGPDFLPLLVRSSFSEHNVAWRAGLNYKPSSNTLIYALISRGYKSGSYPIFNATSYSQLGAVRQEELTNYEVGVKTSALDRAIQFDASAFYYDYGDKQLIGPFLDPIFGPLAKLLNIPKSRVYGIDATLTVVPTRGLTAKGSVVYANSEIRSHVFGTAFNLQNVDQYGKDFYFSPELTANGSLDYEWQMGDLDAGIGTSLSYHSKAYSDLPNSPETLVKPYTTVDFHADLSRGPWSAKLWMRNAFNTHYWYAANRGYGGDTLVRWTLQPRTVGASVGYKFN